MISVIIAIFLILLVIHLFNKNKFNPEHIRGKRVLVTGASSGIGEELAYKYARFGAKLVITARRAQLLEKVAEKCRQFGAEVVHVVAADVAIPSERIKVATETEQLLGGLDFLILNHGIIHYDWWKSTPEEMVILENLMNVNFISHVHLTSLLMKSLEKSRGYIAVVSSISGKCGFTGGSHYCSTKHAIQGFFIALRQELRLRKTGVSVTLAVFGVLDSQAAIQVFNEKHPTFEAKESAGKVEDAVDVLIRDISNRAYETIFPKSAYAFTIFQRIHPRHFEDLINWGYNRGAKL